MLLLKHHTKSDAIKAPVEQAEVLLLISYISCCRYRVCAIRAMRVVALLACCLMLVARAERFSSLASMTQALYNEKQLARELRAYLQAERERLDKVEK